MAEPYKMTMDAAPALRVVPRFSVGDPVVARCGGPIMLVTDNRCNNDHHDVQWFVGGEVRREAFPRDGLRRANWFDRLCAVFGG